MDIEKNYYYGEDIMAFVYSRSILHKKLYSYKKTDLCNWVENYNGVLEFLCCYNQILTNTLSKNPHITCSFGIWIMIFLIKKKDELVYKHFLVCLDYHLNKWLLENGVLYEKSFVAIESIAYNTNLPNTEEDDLIGLTPKEDDKDLIDPSPTEDEDPTEVIIDPRPLSSTIGLEGKKKKPSDLVYKSVASVTNSFIGFVFNTPEAPTTPEASAAPTTPAASAAPTKPAASTDVVRKKVRNIEQTILNKQNRG
jgi:hypothetical protein